MRFIGGGDCLSGMMAGVGKSNGDWLVSGCVARDERDLSTLATEDCGDSKADIR
ncbi:hypothetical protein V3G39_13940 [Dermatophilaceae bacterium Sec6.4]